MSLSDRRLLIELGLVLAIKVAIIMTIKAVYFSPQAEQVPVEHHFLREKAEPQSPGAMPPEEITDKEH